MSIVTRNTFWPYAGDNPYIDLEVKGVLSFMSIYESLDYITPTGEPRLWPGVPEAAKEDGIDLAVHPWEFWLLVDGDRTEISCSDHGCNGIRYEIYNAWHDSQTSIQITESEAVQIKAAVDSMLAEHPTLFSPGQTGFYKPSHKVLAYPAESRRFTRNPEDGPPIRSDTRPKWPASRSDIERYKD
jgi:hypothetical protein